MRGDDNQRERICAVGPERAQNNYVGLEVIRIRWAFLSISKMGRGGHFLFREEHKIGPFIEVELDLIKEERPAYL